MDTFEPLEFFFPFLGAMVLVGLASFAFGIWMLVDSVQRPAEHFSPPESRVWWIVGLAVGLVLGFIGLAVSLVYFFIVRKPAIEGRVASPALCAACGVRQRPGARFCNNCGSPIAQETT